MTDTQKIWIAVILTTLNESNGSSAGMIYTAMGMDMRSWEFVRDVLVDAKLIKVSAGHYVTITPDGRVVANKIEAAQQPA